MFFYCAQFFGVWFERVIEKSVWFKRGETSLHGTEQTFQSHKCERVRLCDKCSTSAAPRAGLCASFSINIKYSAKPATS